MQLLTGVVSPSADRQQAALHTDGLLPAASVLRTGAVRVRQLSFEDGEVRSARRRNYVSPDAW